MDYSREIAIKLGDPRAFELHFEAYGYAIAKHLSSYIAFLHGSETGELPKLDKVQAAAKRAGIEIKAYVCCFPLSCRKTHPDLNILGGWNSLSGFDIDKHGIHIYIA